jgi:hypothetical protein
VWSIDRARNIGIAAEYYRALYMYKVSREYASARFKRTAARDLVWLKEVCLDSFEQGKDHREDLKCRLESRF